MTILQIFLFLKEKNPFVNQRRTRLSTLLTILTVFYRPMIRDPPTLTSWEGLEGSIIIIQDCPWEHGGKRVQSRRDFDQICNYLKTIFSPAIF